MTTPPTLDVKVGQQCLLLYLGPVLLLPFFVLGATGIGKRIVFAQMSTLLEPLTAELFPLGVNLTRFGQLLCEMNRYYDRAIIIRNYDVARCNECT